MTSLLKNLSILPYFIGHLPLGDVALLIDEPRYLPMSINDVIPLTIAFKSVALNVMPPLIFFNSLLLNFMLSSYLHLNGRKYPSKAEIKNVIPAHIPAISQPDAPAFILFNSLLFNFINLTHPFLNIHLLVCISY